jgi:hypothetical protein
MIHLSRAVISVVDQHHVGADPELNSDPTPDFTLVGKSKKKIFSESAVLFSERSRGSFLNFFQSFTLTEYNISSRIHCLISGCSSELKIALSFFVSN